MTEVFEGLGRFVDLHGGSIVLAVVGCTLVAVAALALVHAGAGSGGARGRRPPGRRRGARKRRGRGPARPLARPAALAVLVVTLSAAAGLGFVAFGRTAHANASAATISAAEDGATREALVSELDRQVADGMMVVTLNPRLVMGSAGENLYVGFANDPSNHAAQRFQIMQKGTCLYTSDIVGVGEECQTIAMPAGLVAGEAVVRVQALNGDGTDQGSPTEVKVTVVGAPASKDKEANDERKV